jgi:hypothetical protein
MKSICTIIWRSRKCTVESKLMFTRRGESHCGFIKMMSLQSKVSK